jgi:solute carrier family 35 protein F1/2
MASKTAGSKTSAIETLHDISNGDSYRKTSDGLEGNGEQSRSIEMGAREVNAEDIVDPEVLEYAIEALESKKKAWYAYLLTRDFWVVLLIGFVHTMH